MMYLGRRLLFNGGSVSRMIAKPRIFWNGTSRVNINRVRYYNVKHTIEDIDELSTNDYHKISDDYLELLTDHLVELGQDYPQVDAEYSVSYPNCLNDEY